VGHTAAGRVLAAATAAGSVPAPYKRPAATVRTGTGVTAFGAGGVNTAADTGAASAGDSDATNTTATTVARTATPRRSTDETLTGDLLAKLGSPTPFTGRVG
jgi:hypothetical protein